MTDNPKVTAAERAENIVELVYNRIASTVEWDRRELAVQEIIAQIKSAEDSARAEALEEVLRIGDDNKPEFKDIHPQLQWFLAKIRSLSPAPSDEKGGAA